MCEKVTDQQLKMWQAAYDGMAACKPWKINIDCSEESVANIKFIEAASAAVPKLIAEVRRLKAERLKMLERCKEGSMGCCENYKAKLIEDIVRIEEENERLKEKIGICPKCGGEFNSVDPHCKKCEDDWMRNH